MTEGKDTSGGTSQGGSARSAGAVGKAAVGRAMVDGGDAPSSTPPAPNGKASPAEETTPDRRPAPLPAVPANRSSSAPPAASTSKPSAEPAKQTAPSMSGALRPSVVQAGGAPASPAAARPAAPSGEVGLSKPTAHITSRQATSPGPSAPPESATQIASPPAAQSNKQQAPGLGKRPQPSAPPAAAKGRATASASVPVPGSGAPVGATSALGAGAAGAGAAGGSSTARAQVGEAVRNVRATVAAAASRGPRRARLQLKKIDPWSVMKFSFAASIVLFIVFVVATALLYSVLDALGVWDSLNKTIGQLTATSDQSAGASAAKAAADSFAIDAKLIIGGAALLGAVNMVLVTALMTLAAFIYNVCADLVGGIEVTLAERD